MNWDALGALAEMVGAAAVVVTLAYLATQIRRSNLLATAESNRFGQEASNLAIAAIVHDPEVARIFREGLTVRDSLSVDDKIRFDMLMGSFIGGITTAMTDQELLGHRGDFRAPDQSESVRAFLLAPGGASWWAAYKQRYSPRVRSLVDEILGTAKTPAA